MLVIRFRGILRDADISYYNRPSRVFLRCLLNHSVPGVPRYPLRSNGLQRSLRAQLSHGGKMLHHGTRHGAASVDREGRDGSQNALKHGGQSE
jgi:hypothetical protein